MRDLGFRLFLTGALMITVGIALAVTELLADLGPGGAFSLSVLAGGAVVALLGWLLDRRPQ